jgi:hypothetical protein
VKKITGEITHAELVGHVQYGYWFNLLNEIVYSRISLVCNFMQLIAGTGAFFTAFGDHLDLLKWFGLIVAVCALISILINPSVKAEQHKVAKENFLELESRAWNMQSADLQSQICLLRSKCPSGMDALGTLAFNRHVQSVGADNAYLIPETFTNKIYKLLT